MALPDFSPEEQAVIEELKRRTADIVTPKMLEDNYRFYRYVKARDFNLAEAEIMLRKNVAWRKEMGIDKMLTDYKPPGVLLKYVASCLVCFDKEGCAVRYTDTGRIDAKGLWNCDKKQEILKYFAYLLEQDQAAVLKRNKKLQKQYLLAIFDFENLPLTTATHMKTIQYLAYFLKSYFDNFPEILKYAYIINAPFYFIWMFAALKQVFPARVLQKIRIYGTDGWREDLLDLVDADVLPAFLGGNRTDPDGNPQCNTIVKQGVPIPKCYYMSKEKKNLGPDFKKLTILPLSKQEISFEVIKANSNLEWEYEVIPKDIDFSLHFKGETLETVQLIPKQRIDTCYETEKGLLKCENVGTYTMVLDNTYSWFQSKEVYYRANINPPNDDRSRQWL